MTKFQPNWKPFHFEFDLKLNKYGPSYYIFHLMPFKDSDLVVYKFCATNQFYVPFFEICLAKMCKHFCHLEKNHQVFWGFFFGQCIVRFIIECCACEMEL